MMEDRPLSATVVASALLWVVGVALVGTDLLFGHGGAGRAGLLSAMGGATLTVRRFACNAVDSLVARERNAFELGQDAARLRSTR